MYATGIYLPNNSERNKFNFTLVMGLVISSATLEFVRTYFSLMKWCLMSMFFRRSKDPCLSPWILIGFSSTIPKSLDIIFKNSACWVAAVRAMYSASQLDKAIVCCFLLFHEMQLHSRSKQNNTRWYFFSLVMMPSQNH